MGMPQFSLMRVALKWPLRERHLLVATLPDEQVERCPPEKGRKRDCRTTSV
jgi:hypothetical protein